MSHDAVILILVVGGRFFLPLLILRYPLPGIILSMLLDGVDQTIFQTFTHLNLENYQGYDKALDIYYLTIAYISTMRNWVNLYAYKVSAFLFYYRMIGDLLFQLTAIRAVLLIFPNTFEYFFDFYEGVKLRWNPIRLSPKVLIAAAAFIWIFIKLPQEYWIHVAQLDTTDLIKTKIFGVPTDTTFAEIFKMFPLTLPILAAVVIGLMLLGWWLLKKLPKADHKLSWEAIPGVVPNKTKMAKYTKLKQLFNRELIEKVSMMTLIVIIFAQVLPGVKASNAQLAVAVVIILLANTFLVFFLDKVLKTKISMAMYFLITSLLNIVLVVIYSVASPSLDSEINLNAAIFFSIMVGLLVTLYDTYNPYHQARFAKK